LQEEQPKPSASRHTGSVNMQNPLSTSDASAWHQRGRELQLQGDSSGAEHAYQQALALDPHYRRSLNNLAVLLMQRFEPEQAESLLQRGLSEGPGQDPQETALLLNTLCQLRLQQQRAAEALAVARRLVQLAPEPLHFTNLAVALQISGQPQAALRAQRQALELAGADPDPTQLRNLATMELALDPFSQRGWRLLEARLAAQPQAQQGLWNGDRVPELLVWDEQGFGDAIQCLRWLPAVAHRAERLTLWFRPELLPLVQQRLLLPSHALVQAWPPGAEPWQQSIPHLPLMSQPLALNLTGPPLAAGVPLRRQRPPRRPGPRRLGLVWAAGRKPEVEADRQARRRSLPLAQLMAVLQGPVQQGNLRLQSLQVGADSQEAEAWRPWLELSPALADWEDTARALEKLDGLISVDTAVAHLAGSLGVPTLLLLPEPCDWRWGLQGERTPWYPSVRLLRFGQASLADDLLRWIYDPTVSSI
jgi:Flp pilus assembly protein TadD